MQEDRNNILALLPGVDRLLSHQALEVFPPDLRLWACREAIESLREDFRNGKGKPAALPGKEALLEKAASMAAMFAEDMKRASLRPVINCTGIVLHTNLGRAVLSEKAIQAASEAGRSYSNLEYNLETGQRGSRQDHAKNLLRFLTGTEDAIVVNNNAAAIFLTLTALARNKEAVISRGQLIEIGDTFRIPEILELSGTVLKAVGTTNRTRIADYEKAIGENTALLVYVHPANFTMTGFTEEVTISELCKLGEEKNIPVVADLGSGWLYNFFEEGTSREPIVSDVIKAGCSLVTFSGDKLLGGPQAGVIAGEKRLIEQIKKNPFLRTVRIDKLTLAAFEATLAEYLDPEKARQNIPSLAALTAGLPELEARAEELFKAVHSIPGINAEIKKGVSPVGGGSMPDCALNTMLVTLMHENLSLTALAKRLRLGSPPVLAYIHDDSLLFDVRTIRDFEIGLIAEALAAAAACSGAPVAV